MHIVAHDATPILGMTPRKNPRRPFACHICFAVDIIVGVATDEVFLTACMSTLMTCCFSLMLAVVLPYHLFKIAYLERLVPTAQRTTNRGRCDLFSHIQFLRLAFPSESPDWSLGRFGYSHAAAPACDLTEGYCIDTFVDPSNALSA